MTRIDSIIDEVHKIRNPKRLLAISEHIKGRLHLIMGHESWTDPMGHYAEWLTQKVFGGELSPPSRRAYDLVDKKDRRIQVKARVLRGNQLRKRVAIKTKNIGDFDYLVLVVFRPDDYEIVVALGMTEQVFQEVSTLSEDEERWTISSHLSAKGHKGVKDLTDKFKAAEHGRKKIEA